MTEKIVTVEKTMLGKRIGKLTAQEMHIIAGKLAKLLEISKNDIEE
jgi:mRNA-degrading endonuclease toxin of MazEF toxin-antitoxin module